MQLDEYRKDLKEEFRIYEDATFSWLRQHAARAHSDRQRRVA